MEKIVIYGKGGIGKSTICGNLSAVYAKKGYSVLHIGCDPKQDSTIRLTNGRMIPTVMDLKSDNLNLISKDMFITKGIYNIDCIECGGPEAGVGCAGRGITKMFEILNHFNITNDASYDISIYDVLGDVVCGGFAAPLKAGYGEKVFIVISEEIMSLYAANRIIKAINIYEDNGIFLGALILNVRDNKADFEYVKMFGKLTNTNIIAVIPRSELILKAEKENMTIIEYALSSKIENKFSSLSEKIINIDRKNYKKPNPIENFNSFINKSLK